MASPNLAFDYLVEGQNAAEVTVNEALNLLDALLDGAVVDMVTTDPTGLTPVNGQKWIVAAGGTDVWTGQDGKLAAYYDGWIYRTPKKGWLFTDLGAGTHGKLKVFNGTTWDDVFSLTA